MTRSTRLNQTSAQRRIVCAEVSMRGVQSWAALRFLLPLGRLVVSA